MSARVCQADAEAEELREFIYLMPIGVVRFAGDGTITMLNPAVTRLLLPLTGHRDFFNVFDVLADLCPHLGVQVAAFQSPSGTIVDQRPIPCPGARSETTLLLTVTRVRPDTHIAVLKDITRLTRARAAAEAALAALREEVAARQAIEQQFVQAQKMEAIGELTGGMAHDFNNLLAIIIGNIDLLHEHVANDPDAAQLSQDALAAAIRGGDLTRQLLAFARRQPLAPEICDLNTVIADFLRLLRRTLGEAVVIRHDAEPDLASVLIDRVQFEAVIANLATNARDAMPHGGEIVIATRNVHVRPADPDAAAGLPAGDHVMVLVRDSGAGMPDTVLCRIFEPFFTTKERTGGTGLGLSMVFGFIKQSGGTIAATSQPGVGTEFRIHLPAVAAPAVPAAAPAPSPAVDDREVILVVEDQDDLRRLLVHQLKVAGYDVRAAANGPEAMDLIALAGRIDLLLTDFLMPGGMTGADLAAAAARQRPALKVLMTSGFPGSAYSVADRPAGVTLLAKPYRMTALLDAVRDALHV